MAARKQGLEARKEWMVTQLALQRKALSRDMLPLVEPCQALPPLNIPFSYETIHGSVWMG